MPIIVVSNPKGGVGKSTAALIIGSTLARHGASVTVFDCDPNRVLEAWRSGPSKNSVKIVAHGDGSTIARTLRAEATQQQFVIVDLEGTASLMVSSACLTADLVLVPMQGSALDATQARRAVSMIEDQAAAVGAKEFRLLFTRTKPGFATRDERAIRERLTANSLPIMRTDLAERAAFRSIFTYRLALEELDHAAVNGVEKAMDNADALAGEIVELIKKRRAA